MLLTKYKMVSATSRIVFTCFLLCLTSFSNAQINKQQSPYYSDATDQQQAMHHQAIQQSLKGAIEQQVSEYITAQVFEIAQNVDFDNVRVSVRELDDRIRLAQCNTPYELSSNFASAMQTNVAVKVSCQSADWYVFVHANVSIVEQVVVTTNTLSPGTLLNSSNLRVIEVDKSRLRGSTFSNIDDVVGARIKRRVRSGNVVSNNMLCFVCKGDRVTIAAVAGGLSVKVYGVAQQDGKLGDTIQVRNTSSDKLIFAKIASTSQVEVSI